MAELIKIQRPIYPEDGPMLVTSFDGELEVQLPMNGMLAAALGNGYKAYFEARVDEDGTIYLLRPRMGRGGETMLTLLYQIGFLVCALVVVAVLRAVRTVSAESREDDKKSASIIEAD